MKTLKEIREENHLSIHALANKANLADHTIIRMERGRPVLRKSKRKLAEALSLCPENIDFGHRFSNIGSRLKEIRINSKITQRKLADFSGVSHPTICNIERGKRKPQVSTIRKLAKAMGVEPNSIDW